jgi:formylglycine-generating enzyme required for sulfatase activity
LFEADADVIATAADRQMSHVRTYQSGAHGELSQRLLNELSAARLCLLKPDRKAQYDNDLRQSLRARTATLASAPVGPPSLPPHGQQPASVPIRVVAPNRADGAEAVQVAALLPLGSDKSSTSDGDFDRGYVPRRAARKKTTRSRVAPWLLAVAVASLLAIVGAVAWGPNQPLQNAEQVPTVASSAPVAENSSPSKVDDQDKPAVDRPADTSNATPTQKTDKVVPSPELKKPKSGTDDPKSKPIVSPPAIVPDIGQPANADNQTPNDVQPVDKTTEPTKPPTTTITDLLDEIDPDPDADADKGMAEEMDEGDPLAADDEFDPDDELPADEVAPVAAIERLAMPAPEQVATARDRIREVFAGEIAAAKTHAAKADLSLLLTQQALETRGDPPAQFAMLTMAQEFGLAANYADRVFEAIDRRGERFEFEEIGEKTQALLQLEKGSKTREGRENLLRWVEGLIAQALDGENYECAEKLAAFQLRSLRGSRDKELLKSAVFREKEVKDLAKLFAAAESARRRLAENADDANANLELGTYLCFVRNDWVNGANYLSKCGDTALQAIAQQELTESTDPKAQFTLAEAWYQFADAKKPFAQAARLRARNLYAMAVDHLQGLDKTQAEKRLATLMEELAGTVASALVTIELAPGVKLPMRQVPAGKFTMGSPANEPGRDADEIAHEVVISKSFLLGQTEITQAQWESVMGWNPSQPQDPNLPVSNVSWQDAVNFCDRVNDTAPGNKYRFRLPTEAEWEYACRAGTRGPFYWGNSPMQLDQFAWSRQKSGGVLRPVTALRPNAWGFYDMQGNVAEWTADWRSPLPAVPQRDPQGPDEGFRKLHRGGHVLLYMPKSFRSAARDGSTPGVVRGYIGFRVAADIL